MKKEYSFPSSDGITKIHVISWLPDEGSPKAILQLVHGMIEYIERYDEFANYMTTKGFIVIGHDHLCHGKSVKSAEDLGFIADNNPSDKLIHDINRLRIATAKKYPDLPYFMLGHSMGSYLLRKYISQYGNGLAGAIVMGTGCESDIATLGGLALIKAKAKKYGWHYRDTKIRDLTYTAPYKRYNLDGTDVSNSWLSKNEENVTAYYNNPLNTFTFTLNGYEALLTTVLYTNQKKNIDSIPKDLPILIVSGEDDPVGNLGNGVKKVYQKFVQAGIKDVVCHLFPNDRHEILNETDREDVYTYIGDWLDEHYELEKIQ